MLDRSVPRVIACTQRQSTPCSSVSTQVLPLVPLTLLFYSFVTRRFERPVAWGALDTLIVDRPDASVAMMKAADRNLGLESQERISLKDGEENRPEPSSSSCPIGSRSASRMSRSSSGCSSDAVAAVFFACMKVSACVHVFDQQRALPTYRHEGEVIMWNGAQYAEGAFRASRRAQATPRVRTLRTPLLGDGLPCNVAPRTSHLQLRSAPCGHLNNR